uniref:Uncharacterized protein n=1 Tax=Rhizophora mucronata TaxID=61149 RepID=A0A2P2QZQ8_RHIMU
MFTKHLKLHNYCYYRCCHHHNIFLIKIDKPVQTSTLL